MRDLLGGKGANLAEMSRLGLAVPPGFTISTEVCSYYYQHDRRYPDGLADQVEAALGQVEAGVAARFGDPERPLLVSVRSGAPLSMPGMMDTVLNLGLNDRTVEGLATATGQPRFAYDSYRRFIQMYGDVVLGVDHYLFEDQLDDIKRQNGCQLDTDLATDDLVRLIEALSGDRARADRTRRSRRTSSEQLWGAIGAVFGSWMTPRAVTYRRLHGIDETMGTAVSVQAMVFGNRGDSSATGVAFTRDPSTGDKRYYGEFLVNAQGEDVVAGIRTPQPLTRAMKQATNARLPAMEEVMPRGLCRARRGVRSARGALSRHAGHRVHGPGGPAVDPADAERQAHHPRRAQDRGRHGRRGPDRARRRDRPDRARLARSAAASDARSAMRRAR